MHIAQQMTVLRTTTDGRGSERVACADDGAAAIACMNGDEECERVAGVVCCVMNRISNCGDTQEN